MSGKIKNPSGWLTAMDETTVFEAHTIRERLSRVNVLLCGLFEK